MASSTHAASTVINCKKCNTEVINGAKCTECGCVYHIRYAKLLDNVKFVDNKTITSCVSDAWKIECDEAFFDAIDSLPGAEKKIDVHIIIYIIK